MFTGFGTEKQIICELASELQRKSRLAEPRAASNQYMPMELQSLIDRSGNGGKLRRSDVTYHRIGVNGIQSTRPLAVRAPLCRSDVTCR
jgi:hypothetical protein